MMESALTSEGQKDRASLLQNAAGLDSIKMVDVSFVSSVDSDAGEEKLSKFSMNIDLGMCYRVINRDAAFANTSLFMRIAAGQLDPSTGLVKIPPHLSLRVSMPTPMLSDTTLMENLRMGEHLNEMVDVIPDDIVFDIAEKFGLSKKWRGNPQAAVGRNGANMSSKDCAAVQFTRAIISNPSVLFVAKPASMTSFSHQQHIVKTLLAWKANSGIAELTARGMPGHPRTLLIQDLDITLEKTELKALTQESYDKTIVLEGGSVKYYEPNQPEAAEPI